MKNKRKKKFYNHKKSWLRLKKMCFKALEKIEPTILSFSLDEDVSYDVKRWEIAIKTFERLINVIKDINGQLDIKSPNTKVEIYLKKAHSPFSKTNNNNGS